ncbi:hypothetical protein DE146DRAFT_279822 [Phaeosphaeria sp. MPI-PUGE-AT-0046c]|nr:hypothetical protein DE146DRAFT_279822 [Phaeosphaeria sp. MPI-PUGE-AT-0046c]
MRYTSAVVLSTLAVGQAAASNSHNRHASFHARREASKRGDPALDWSKLTYDLKDVNWEKINWSSVLNSPAAATPTAKQEKPAAIVTPTPEAKKETAAAAPTSTKAAEASPSAKNDHSSNPIGDIVDDVFAGVASIASALGAQVGKNDKSNNGGIWVGSDSKWGLEVTNNGNSDAVFYCWQSNGYTGMSVNKFKPDVSVGMKKGQTVKLSFAENVPAACAPATSTGKLAMFGGIDDTWAEVTFGQWGAFDVSRNVNMNGCNISMQGSKCKSDMNTCVFKCQDANAKSCEKGYKLDNCDASNGGGGGYDPKMDGVGGGCAMGSSGEWIKVAFN